MMAQTRRRARSIPLGPRQMELLEEAALEVSRACPWLPIYYSRRVVDSLERRGMIGATHDLFGIMPAGCLVLRRRNRELARSAIKGLRRNSTAGEVMPWHV